MCLRFVFLLITRVAAWPRLSQREEAWRTAEILVLRHQLAILQRRPCRPRLNWADRALLAALLAVIPKARRRACGCWTKTKWSRRRDTADPHAHGRALFYRPRSGTGRIWHPTGSEPAHAFVSCLGSAGRVTVLHITLETGPRPLMPERPEW